MATNVEEEEGDEYEEEAPVEIKFVEQTATFDEIVIWGHDAVPEEADNPYINGVQEWIAFAEAASALDLVQGSC